MWRGKDEKDWSDLVVHAPPLYIQEKVHPKVLVDDLLRQSKPQPEARKERQLDLFADFNGVPEHAKSAEFYQHDANWTNRMILGDSLQVMATLAEREGLRGSPFTGRELVSPRLDEVAISPAWTPRRLKHLPN